MGVAETEDGRAPLRWLAEGQEPSSTNDFSAATRLDVALDHTHWHGDNTACEVSLTH